MKRRMWCFDNNDIYVIDNNDNNVMVMVMVMMNIDDNHADDKTFISV